MFISWPLGWLAYDQQFFTPISWHGTLVEGKRDGAQTLYRRNREYDPVTGRFTQEDPIGLAGGLNLYGYANGDPLAYSDPFGLKVCLSGKDVKSLARAIENATNTTFGLDAANCVIDVQAAGQYLTEAGSGFAAMARDSLFMVPIEFGNGGSRNDKSGIIIDKSQIGTPYGTAFIKPGFCSTSRGATFTEPSIVAHELGHAYGTYRSMSKEGNDQDAMRWENAIYQGDGKPLRNEQCHTKD